MERRGEDEFTTKNRGHGVSEMNLGILIAARVSLIWLGYLAEPLRVVGRSIEMLTGFIKFILTFGRRLSRPTK
jgi:hypothetical protein